MSWAVTRSVVSARRTLPSKTVRTRSFSPIARMSSLAPLNANADVRDATRSEGMELNAFRISSAMPSQKYPFSGSALRFTNGNTAIECSGAGAVWARMGVGSATVTGPGVLSAATNSAAPSNRSAGAFASARVTACSSHWGTVSRNVRTRGRGSSTCRARIACADHPVKGGPPASISNSTQPRL